jgi:hypothetical protein
MPRDIDIITRPKRGTPLVLYFDQLPLIADNGDGGSGEASSLICSAFFVHDYQRPFLLDACDDRPAKTLDHRQPPTILCDLHRCWFT